MTNAKSNYKRCTECQTVYEKSKKSCPNCGTLNEDFSIQEFDNSLCESASEPVFNILD